MEDVKAFRRVLVVGLIFASVESAAASRRRRLFFLTRLMRAASASLVFRGGVSPCSAKCGLHSDAALFCPRYVTPSNPATNVYPIA